MGRADCGIRVQSQRVSVIEMLVELTNVAGLKVAVNPEHIITVEEEYVDEAASYLARLFFKAQTVRVKITRLYLRDSNGISTSDSFDSVVLRLRAGRE